MIAAHEERNGKAGAGFRIAAIERDRAPSLVLRLGQVAVALYFCREYAAAVEAARQAIRSFPDHPRSYRVLAAALGPDGSDRGSDGGAEEGRRDRAGGI